jgi:tRNA threonylcarbamoyladenosine biosynthesis protein TsaB
MTRKILAIECSSELCSVALDVDGETSVREALAPREHAYLVLPFAEALLQEKGLAFSELDAVGFGQGPGAFTGLRVAASIAQGLALANELELLAGCSLHALALQMEQFKKLKEGDRVLAVFDARMSELYWAAYKMSGNVLIADGEAQLGSIEKLCEKELNPAYFLGPGCRHLLEGVVEAQCLNLKELQDFTEVFPHARELVSLLSIDDKREEELPFPVYLRNNVAAKPKQV